MVKRLVSLMVFWLVCSVVLSIVGGGAENSAFAASRPMVAIFPVVNSSNVRASQYMVDMVNDELARKFDSSRYLTLSGPVLSDALQNYGLDDYMGADADGAQAALRDMQVTYSIRVELMPVNTRQKVSLPDVLMLMKTWVATVSVSCTVINVRTGAVVYDGTITDQGAHESFIGFASKEQAIRGALTRVLDRLDREMLIPE